jgi:hypothetical protein
MRNNQRPNKRIISCVSALILISSSHAFLFVFIGLVAKQYNFITGQCHVKSTEITYNNRSFCGTFYSRWNITLLVEGRKLDDVITSLGSWLEETRAWADTRRFKVILNLLVLKYNQLFL